MVSKQQEPKMTEPIACTPKNVTGKRTSLTAYS